MMQRSRAIAMARLRCVGLWYNWPMLNGPLDDRKGD
jgi:hypothetical protein